MGNSEIRECPPYSRLDPAVSRVMTYMVPNTGRTRLDLQRTRLATIRGTLVQGSTCRPQQSCAPVL